MPINLADDTEERIRVIGKMVAWFQAEGITQADALIACGSFLSISLATRANNEADLEIGVGLLTKSIRNESLKALRAKALLHNTQNMTKQ